MRTSKNLYSWRYENKHRIYIIFHKSNMIALSVSWKDQTHTHEHPWHLSIFSKCHCFPLNRSLHNPPPPPHPPKRGERESGFFREICWYHAWDRTCLKCAWTMLPNWNACKLSKITVFLLKVQRRQQEESTIGKRWANLSFKKNSCNELKYIQYFQSMSS